MISKVEIFKNSIVINIFHIKYSFLIVPGFCELPSERQVVLRDVVYRLEILCLLFQYLEHCSRSTLPMDKAPQ